MADLFTQELERRVRALPGSEGWWKESAYETYLKAGKRLAKEGWTVDWIVDFLESLRSAAGEEFGC